MNRVIVVGDVQGCLDELLELMKEVEYKEGVDRLILAGDLLDRGPDSAGVVTWAMTHSAEAVMGNHEESHLRFKQHDLKAQNDPKYKNPMRPRPPGEPHRVVYDSISTEQWEWLAKLPQYLHVDDKWTVIHAGCMPDITVEKQNPTHLMRLRYLRLPVDGKPLRMVSDLKEPMGPSTHCFWTEKWNGPRSLIYGHHVEKTGPVLTINGVHQAEFKGNDHCFYPEPDDTHTLGIDTGCCFGHTLTAAVFDSGMIYTKSVAAHGKYGTLYSDED